ncbi:hypothetical protein [Flavobacterium sp.]|uniref:hypothetical protein n=1 Tax=Flavobacterium sp. TaxID=239 RepID=UPI003BCCA8CB
MSKKKIDKKKINIKLESGQTYLVTSIDGMFQIANSLIHLASSIKDEKDKLSILHLSEEAVKAISENKFTGGSFDEEDWV